MTGDLIGSASGFELLFLASAIVGIKFGRSNLSEAWADYGSLGGITNGRRAIALESIVSEMVMLTVHGLYVLAAVIAMGVSSPGAVSTSSVLIQTILVVTSWGITANSIIRRRTRRYLMTYGLQARDEHGRFTKDQ